MKKRIFILMVVFIIVGLCFFSGCKKDSEQSVGKSMVQEEVPEKTPEPQKIELDTSPATSSEKWLQMVGTDIDTLETGDAKSDANKIFVVSFHPQGQTRKVDEVDEINITFSEPVAALRKVEKNVPSLISIDPFIKGEGYWKSSSTYCYRMDDKLKYSSRYNIKFKGFKSFSGKDVQKKSWSFTTPTIKIMRTTPYHRNKWQTLEKKVLVHFSQDVDPDKIKDYIKIFSNKGEHYFKVKYSNEKERKLLYYWGKDQKSYKKFVTITAKADYPIATDIHVKFLKGLPPIEGNVGLLSDKVVDFRTYEVFKILDVSKTFKPDYGIQIKFSNPVNVRKFVEKVSFEPEVEINKDNDWNSRKFRIKGKFRPGILYKMTIPSGVEDQFGNHLEEEMTYSCECLDYSEYFYPPYHNHFVLENYLEKSIPINIRNIFKTDVYYRELTPQEILKLSTYNYLNLEKIDLNACKKHVWEIPIQKNRDFTLGFKLKDIGITKPGFYFIYFGSTTREYYKGHVFQLTDISVVAKYSPTQIFLLPFNLKTGEPVPGLNFKILGTQSSKKDFGFEDEVKGDKRGIALYNPPERVFTKNYLFDSFVFSEPSKSFVWGKKREMFDLWSFEYESGLNYNYNPGYFYDHLLTFTDKYLYKGGQEVKFKGILRLIISGDMRIPKIKGVKVQVFNSRNESIKKFKLDTSDITSNGSFAGKFLLPQDAPTGFYRIDFNVLLPETKVSKSLTFSVQEYKPAKFEVKVNFDQQTLIAGEDFSGKVNGRYLFGTPMMDAEGKCTWRIQNTYYAPPGWARYIFGTYDSHYRRTIFKKDFKLDQEGYYSFGKDDFSFEGKNSGRLTVHGEVKDKDNNRISGSRSMVVHRGQYYIGLKTDSYFFEQGKPGKVLLVTVDPKGGLVKDTEVDIKIVREEWKSFQKKDASGSLRWEWKKLVEDVEEDELSLPGGKLEKEYTFKKPGYYKVELKGKDKYDNVITTTGNFYVTGSGYVCWGVNEGRIIDLETDKKQYKPGENIELLVKSPFETSTVLVTVEREKVIWSQVERMKGNANTIKIPVVKDFMPNVYINVIILKERTGLKWDEDGQDIGKPEFYSGYKEVKIDSKEHKLNLLVKADKTSYEPGGTVNLQLEVTDQQGNPREAEVCLSVVDKGVLNLVGYELPDPFLFFWKDRPLDVKTVSTLNDVLDRRKFQEKGEDPGGGGDVSAFGSVVVRKNFKESAWYSAFVNTDKNGNASITFKLPDNLTTFKAMAVAGDNDNKFGKGNTDLLVKKKIILKPALPDFARPYDRFSAGVTVTNNWEKTLEVAVEVKAEDVDRIEGEPDVKKVTLKPGETQPVWFKFKVNSTETCKLTFKAVAGEFKDGLYQEIPIRVPQFLEAVANYGRVDEAPVKEQVIVPDGTFRPLDNVEVTLASSSMVGVRRNLAILQEFPYDCLEQRISKELPLLGAGEFLLTYGLLDMTPEEITKRIQGLLKLIPKYQTSNGAFKYYPDSWCYSDYLTCYVVEFIMEAKKRGYQYDKEMLRKAQGFLRKVANHAVNSKYPYSKNVYFLIQSYAVYTLSMDNIFMKDAVNNLFEVRDRIPFSGLAYLVKTLEIQKGLPEYMQPVLAKTLLNKMKDEPTMTHFENHEDKS
jgi:uncharacterized protein YfaS (alpha-2-macroglobulin family)